MTFTNGIPNIRIGVVQTAEKVNFKCNTAFRLFNSNGRELFTGVADEKYEFTIGSSNPAEIRYQVRAGIERDLSRAKKWADKLSGQGFEAQIRTVGLSFDIQNRKIDNREHWITIGDFLSYEEALKFRNSQNELGEFVVGLL